MITDQEKLAFVKRYLTLEKDEKGNLILRELLCGVDYVHGSVPGAVFGSVGKVQCDVGSIGRNVLSDIGGDVRGDVGGNVCGNVYGNVWGDVCGHVEGNVYGSVWCDVLGGVDGTIGKGEK